MKPVIKSMGPSIGGASSRANTLNPAEAEEDPTRNVAWWMQESDPLGLLRGLDTTQVQQAARAAIQYQYGYGNLSHFQSIFGPGQQPEEVQHPQPTGVVQDEAIAAVEHQLLADITAHLNNGGTKAQLAGTMPRPVTWNTTGLSKSTRPRTRPPRPQPPPQPPPQPQPAHQETSSQSTIIDPRYSDQKFPGAAKRQIDDTSEIITRKKPSFISKAVNELGGTADLSIDAESSSTRSDAQGPEFGGIPASHPNQPRSAMNWNRRRGTPQTRRSGPAAPRGTATTPTASTPEPHTTREAAALRARTPAPGTPRGAVTPSAQSPGPGTPRVPATPSRRATGPRTPMGGTFATVLPTGSPRATAARADKSRRPSRASEQASPPQFTAEEPTGTEDLNIAQVQRPGSAMRAPPSHPDAEARLGTPIQASSPAGGANSPFLQTAPSGRHGIRQLNLEDVNMNTRQGYSSYTGYRQRMTAGEYRAAVAASNHAIGMGGTPTVINTGANTWPTGQLNNPRARLAHIHQHMRRISVPGQVHHQTYPIQNPVAPTQAHDPGIPQDESQYFEQLKARLEARLEEQRALRGNSQSDDHEQEQAHARDGPGPDYGEYGPSLKMEARPAADKLADCPISGFVSQELQESLTA